MSRPTGPANRTLPQTTRRDVIKLGGAIAAGAVLSSGVPCVHAASDNTIRLALIGCGGRGRGAVADAFYSRHQSDQAPCDGRPDRPTC